MGILPSVVGTVHGRVLEEDLGRTPGTDPRAEGAEAEALRAPLLAWYREARRDLPWRRTRDPYRVWLSEAMCQQTRVETAVPYYERFLARFPDVAALARAPLEDVLAAWAGLGYYSRARNLHAAARAVALGGGRFPETVEGLLRLPGVGRYSAGAIASISFGVRAPVVDGNVRRVLGRVFALAADGATGGSGPLWDLAGSLVPAAGPGDFNQALMELGALVCTPVRPACGRCPLDRRCRALAEGRIGEFPARAARVPPRRVERAGLAARDGSGSLLLARRRSPGLLGGLWELPAADVAPGEDPVATARRLAAMLGGTIGLPLSRVGRVYHVFTHLEMGVTLFEPREWPAVTIGVPPGEYDRTAFLDLPARGSVALSALTRKALAALGEPDGRPGPVRPGRYRPRRAARGTQEPLPFLGDDP